MIDATIPSMYNDIHGQNMSQDPRKYIFHTFFTNFWQFQLRLNGSASQPFPGYTIMSVVEFKFELVISIHEDFKSIEALSCSPRSEMCVIIALRRKISKKVSFWWCKPRNFNFFNFFLRKWLN